jgi:hypothetical protein
VEGNGSDITVVLSRHFSRGTEEKLLRRAHALSEIRTEYLLYTSLERYRSLLLFFIINGVGLSPLGTAATSALLYKPQVEQLVE